MSKRSMALRCDVRQMLSVRTILYTIVTSMLYVTLLSIVQHEGVYIEDVLLRLVGGFAYEEIIALEMDSVFVWTLLLMSYLRCVLVVMQAEYGGRCKDSLYRFSTYRSWYTNKALAATISCIGITFFIALGAILGALVWGNTDWGTEMCSINGDYLPTICYCLLAMGLLLVNAIMLTQWQMLVHLATGNAVVATVAFMLPIMASLYSCSNVYIHPVMPQYNPINWGMLMRSNICSDPGFDIGIALCGESAIALLCFLAGRWLSSRVDLAGRCKMN